MNRVLLWLPLILFALIVAVVAAGLIKPADHTIRSHLVGKKLPQFDLPALVSGKPGNGSATFGNGAPRLLNIFASWCVPCAAEAPQLAELERRGITIDAVAIRDTPGDVRAFLKRYGDPYTTIGDDSGGRVQLALGSSGVPETFVIDGNGRIVAQHVGPIRDEDIPGLIAAVEGAR